MSAPRDESTRRALLSRVAVWGAGLGVAGHVVAWTSALAPKVTYEPSPRRRIGRPDRFPEGHTFLPDERVFVLRHGASFRVLSAVCTHLGCTVGVEGEGYHCPCHGSRFDAEGKNTGGPAPSPLAWRPVVRGPGGVLVVDLSREVGPQVTLEVPPSAPADAPPSAAPEGSGG